MQRLWSRKTCRSQVRCRAGCGSRAVGTPLEPPPRPAPDPPPPAFPEPPCDAPAPPCLPVETATAGGGGVTTIAWPPVGVAVTLPYCAVGGGGAAFTWMIASTAQPGNESTLPPPTALSATAARAP